MNAFTLTRRQPGRRIAELDPFGIEAAVEVGARYGCVDWYIYSEDGHAADARAQQAQPRSGSTGPPLVAPRDPRTRAQRH